MNVVHTIAECRAERAKLGELAFVPTMGALHAGHLSLIEIARRHAPRVAVSIFVNPTQFGPQEDFQKYPRPIVEDLAKCQQAAVDLVFNPPPEEMYRPGLPDVVLDLPALTSVLEGRHRPTHFRGVCQVVAKLFNIMQPNVACFGEKDYQQLRVITAMVQAMDWPIRIVSCPTIREPDGMAMSSRNQYLSPHDRQRATAISRGLFAAAELVRTGVRQAARLIALVRHALLEQHLQIDYVSVVDGQTLKPAEQLSGTSVLVVAVRAGNTRLIDNIVLDVPESSRL